MKLCTRWYSNPSIRISPVRLSALVGPSPIPPPPFSFDSKGKPLSSSAIDSDLRHCLLIILKMDYCVPMYATYPTSEKQSKIARIITLFFFVFSSIHSNSTSVPQLNTTLKHVSTRETPPH